MADRVRLAALRDRRHEMVEDLRELVECDSPSTDLAALVRCAGVVRELGQRVCGIAPEIILDGERPHLVWDFSGKPRVLLLGHFDTVWRVGTSQEWPFEVRGDRATGPGVFDMKAGIVQAFFAIASAQKTEGIRLLLTSDEEIGSETSRSLIEELARTVQAALVLEPSLDGDLKTARKGVSIYRLEISGRAAHPGLDPEKGASALTEAAHRILALERLSRRELGTSVRVTLASGGSAANVIPGSADITVDVRALSTAEQLRVDSAIRAQEPTVPGVVTEVRGGINRPPLEPATSSKLFEIAADAHEGLGLGTLHGTTAGGGSDGNLTAAVGTATLDGLGAVGGGAHAVGEWALLSAIPERAALVAELIDYVSGDAASG